MKSEARPNWYPVPLFQQQNLSFATLNLVMDLVPEKYSFYTPRKKAAFKYGSLARFNSHWHWNFQFEVPIGAFQMDFKNKTPLWYPK